MACLAAFLSLTPVGANNALIVGATAAALAAAMPALVGQLMLGLAGGAALLVVLTEPDALSAIFALLILTVCASARKASHALPDRRHHSYLSLDQHAEEELARARRFGYPVTTINMTAAGLNAEEYARSLSPFLRSTDLLAVMSSGSVAVVAPGIDGSEAGALIRRASETMGDTAGIRVGVASFPQDAASWQSLRALAVQRATTVASTASLDTQTREAHERTVYAS